MLDIGGQGGVDRPTVFPVGLRVDFSRKGSTAVYRRRRLEAACASLAGARGFGSCEVTRLARHWNLEPMMRAKSASKAKPVGGRRTTKGEAKRKAIDVAKALPAASARTGTSKQQRCLGLLARKDGASAFELAAATDWQRHSVRGFISGVVRRKLGHTVIATSDADGVRRHRIDTSAPRV